MRDDTGLSAAAAGLLTTAPVLCLGLFAPLAPRLARRIGAERSVLLILFCLAGGIVLRSLFPVFGLFAGSVLAGASIGIIGVLLPGIVKRDFPRQAGVMTGVYTMALCLGAALAAGATAPLEKLFGNWELALAFWSLPAILAAAFWLPQTRQGQHAHRQAFRVIGLWRDPLAWQVTLYMGLQSSLAYIVFGWLPSILIDRGMTAVEAGLVLSGSVMLQLITALLAPWLAARARDQRLAVVLVMATTLAGLLGFLYAPLQTIWGWAVLLGLGQGGTFSIALALIVLRSRDARRLASVGHGPGRRLHPGGHGAVHGRRGPRPDRRLERGRLYLHRRRHRRHPVRPRRRAQPVRGGPQRTPVAPQTQKAPHRGAFSPSSLRHPGRALRRAASAACWRSSR